MTSLDTAEEIKAALDSGDPELISRGLMHICIYEQEYETLIAGLKKFGRHPDPGVRSASLIATIHGEICHGKFDLALAAYLIDEGLNDDGGDVQGNAIDALFSFENVKGFPPPGYEHLIEALKYYDDDDELEDSARD